MKPSKNIENQIASYVPFLSEQTEVAYNVRDVGGDCILKRSKRKDQNKSGRLIDQMNLQESHAEKLNWKLCKPTFGGKPVNPVPDSNTWRQRYYLLSLNASCFYLGRTSNPTGKSPISVSSEGCLDYLFSLSFCHSAISANKVWSFCFDTHHLS